MGEVTHVVGTVGDEHHLLVGGHPLSPQQLVEPPLGLAVVGLHEPEAAGLSVHRHRLAGNHLEPPVPARALVGGVHEAAVEAHDQGQVGSGQPVPLVLAAHDEGHLLGPELVFEPPGHGLGVVADGAGVEGPAQRQDLGQ